MEPGEIVTFLEQHGIRKVKLLACDLDGVLRGKYISLEKFSSAAVDGFGFCDVIFGWDTQDECYDFLGVTGWDSGFPDLLTRIDLDTMRIVPWEPGVVLFLCDFWLDQERPLPVCPRNTLKRVLSRAGTRGYTARASVEYEFWLFRETPQSLQEKGFAGLTPLSPGSFGYSPLRAAQNGRLVHDLMDACLGIQIGIEGLHTETGPGVYEAAIGVQDALEAADQAALFKLTAREIANRYDCTATFMARWSASQAGSSGHVHQSLWEGSGDERHNAFADAGDPAGFSPVMRSYLAGQLALMPALTAVVCPTINSYRRLVPGYWAPTRAAWGIENRTAALRAVRGQNGKATRVEYRLAGADANPYLALAAGIGSGLWGVEHEMSPPDPVHGSAYESAAPPLPATLENAAAAFRASPAAADILGSEFVSHFSATRDWEVRQFRKAVTDWELRRYFEII